MVKYVNLSILAKYGGNDINLALEIIGEIK
jgi:hypothetical protein